MRCSVRRHHFSRHRHSRRSSKNAAAAIPAEAGIQKTAHIWTPAFAGVTVKEAHQQPARRSCGLIVALAVLAAALLPTVSYAQTDIQRIKRVLTEQVEAWNRGEVEGYMKGYWESDSTVFVSGGSLTRGYKELLARYRRSYGTREKMGKLEFSELTIRLLHDGAAVATGIWRLYRAEDKPWGRFTLIFEKKAEGWRITHDHTSLATE